ncbi:MULTISPECIES: FkbM family methyltransferase [unclassified Roseofilum]|uniref:FkbM family methyltransferase n=1 Tax=unclassified Roseofilum TaxID=2620099 RepID=UPI000E83E696|nr:MULTISPECIES: FkbM family methyltransferase [unclassified Roseofilum]MBP0010071.1 FkbM family methyltransferase [Roseofilum sp. Belize Diploria]MBP0034483.1 FkbM family methyltransferase [Roseofilum sp. Belize BBD 4]HBQ98306.1 FkbM family methyltransferase [Cyanobacteria bacterium UBA11691]
MIVSILSWKFNYFFRLAQEIGYSNFLYRYGLRGFHKILKLNQKMVLFNNVEMILPFGSRFGTELFLKREKLDWGSEALLTQFLDGEKVFIDVGANIGYYSLLAAPLSREVYAFEPDPRVIKILEDNISQFQNCHIVKEALYSQVGTMEISLKAMPELNSLVRTKIEDEVEKMTVKVNTLENFMTEYPSVKVAGIKTDAEGADFEILLGAKKLLTRDQPLVLSEAYPNTKLLNFIESIGFSCYAFVKLKGKENHQSKPQLMRIQEKPKKYRTKMIFIVPARLVAEFEKIAHL